MSQALPNFGDDVVALTPKVYSSKLTSCSFGLYYFCMLQESKLNAVESGTVTPSMPANVVKSENYKQPVLPPVIVLSDDEDNEIPDPFPFPKTYSTNIDVSLSTGIGK